MRIGLLCGTFDPIHLGHIDMGNYAMEHCNIDKVIVVPANNPPNKKGKKISSFVARLGMIMTATVELDGFEFSDLERKKNLSYTIDTLNAFDEEYPDDDICLIVGSDTLEKMENWKSYDEIIDKYEVITLERGVITTDISSTEVRKVIEGMNPYVFIYIAMNKVYKDE